MAALTYDHSLHHDWHEWKGNLIGTVILCNRCDVVKTSSNSYEICEAIEPYETAEGESKT